LLARDGFDYREAIVGLAADAIGRMTGLSFTARVSEADRLLLGNGFCEEIAHRIDKAPLSLALSFDQETVRGGVIIEDAGASQVWDNGLIARLERMWPELRWQIAEQASLVPGSESGGSHQ
jgi:hypothetical protein